MLLAFACLRRRMMCMRNVDMPKKWIHMFVLTRKATSFDAVGYAPHAVSLFICCICRGSDNVVDLCSYLFFSACLTKNHQDPK